MRKSYDSKFTGSPESSSKLEETSPGRRLGTLHGAFGTEGRAEEDVHGGRFDEENRTS